MGINGVALSYLIAEVLCAVIVFIPLIRILREKTPAAPAANPEPAPV